MPICKRSARNIALTVLSAVLLNPLTASAASDPTGVWINDTGRGAIEIKPCGGALCGHVVWVKDGSDAKGCGRQIIGDAAPARAGTWDNGWIYSPERKKRYDVELKPLDDKRLRVTGYAGSKFFSKTMIWNRAPDDLQRCGQSAAKPAEPAAADSATATAETEAAPAEVAAAEPPAAPAASGAAALRNTDARRTKAEPAPKAATPAPAQPEPAEEPESAAADEPDPEDTPKETGPDLGNLDLGNLKLDKYLKRDGGKCNLDLPWIKVAFKCRER